MNEPEDIDLDRRLRDHYRATAAGEVPSSLRATVLDGFAPDRRGPSWRMGLSGAAAVVALLVVVGGALVAGTRPVLPAATVPPPAASGGSSASMSTPGPSFSPSTSASSVIPGGVAVLQGAAIRDAAVAATDDTSFLIGGGIVYVMADCAVPVDFPETPLLRVCSDGMVIGNGRGFGGIPIVSDMTPPGPGLRFNEPAVVLRVHTHDERAVACPVAYRIRCEQAIVVEQVVWRAAAADATAIPDSLSLLPPQLDLKECTALALEVARCVAIVDRAKSNASVAWPAIETVELDPPDQIYLGGFEIAAVTFTLAAGTAEKVEVICSLTRAVGVVCGPATVQVIAPSPRPSTP